MIFVVDDEPIFLTLTREALRQEGFEVKTFGRAADALKSLETSDPDLIISDIMMPEMDGFAFREAFTQQFPDRTTPFFFLSSLGEPDQLVRGLETDVDDYLVKPIDISVLQAKVRSILRRRERDDLGVFCGELGLFPFIKVVQFCEHQGLTGKVTFSTDDWRAVVPFKAGVVQLDDIRNADDVVGAAYDLDEIESPDEILERLYDSEHGLFTIVPGTVDFSALGEVGVAKDSRSKASPSPLTQPMGRLSGIKIGDRLFQVQTEMVRYPEERIVTIVVLDGNTVLKRSLSVEAPGARSELEVLIDQQHQEVKAEVHRKIEDLSKAKGAEVETGADPFYKLFDAGFDAYRKGDVERALKFWLEAQALNPDDPTLEINLKIASAKLEAR